jgi:hypothetical protein
MSKTVREKVEGKLRMRVNNATADWTADDKNKLESCVRCGTETRGRGALDAPKRGFANMPCCMACIVDACFSEGGKL